MAMKVKIAITGSEGVIGTVLKKGLYDDYEITPIDIKLGIDVLDYQTLISKLRDNFAVIHLAWNSQTENLKNENIDPENAQMAVNLYKAAREAKVKRAIVASSIHADSFYGTKPFLSTDHTPVPDSPYGADKIFMEYLGRYFAKSDMEVVAIRFGGVNPGNVSPSLNDRPREERGAWLSHGDCVSLIKKVLNAKKVPENFAVIYAVSDNPGRVHDVSNPFGWKPKDSADEFV